MIYEIGGPDRVSYGDLMREYGRLRGLIRPMVPVPLLTPRLSGLWLALVSPVYARVGRELIDGAQEPDRGARQPRPSDFSLRPRGVREMLARALANEDSSSPRPAGPTRSALSGRRGTGAASRSARAGWTLAPCGCRVRPEAAFRPIAQIGGKAGWYYGDRYGVCAAWSIFAMGGPGMRRGRRYPEPWVGDTLDFWRVEAIEPGGFCDSRQRCGFRGEPGSSSSHAGEGRRLIRQTALFDPIGIGGLLYWYGLWGIHQLVFAGMLRSIARAVACGGIGGAPASGLAGASFRRRGGRALTMRRRCRLSRTCRFAISGRVRSEPR